MNFITKKLGIQYHRKAIFNQLRHKELLVLQYHEKKISSIALPRLRMLSLNLFLVKHCPQNYYYFLRQLPENQTKFVSPAFRTFHSTVLIPHRSFNTFSPILRDKEKGVAKPSSQVEVTVNDLKEKASKPKISTITEPVESRKKESSVLPKPVEVIQKSIGTRIKEEILHYYTGFKLLFIDFKICSKYVWRVVQGEVLSRREHRQLIRTTSDFFRLLPFSVFIIIPFMEFLLPVALKLFPGMLPSTFETSNEKEAKLKKTLKVKLEMAKFLQQTLDNMSVQAKGHKSESAKSFVEFFEQVRKTGETIEASEILKFSKLFQDEITLDSLTRPQLTALCKLLEMQPFGTNNFLRFQLRMKLRSLAADDKIIDSEGLESLAVWELQQACRARGMRAYGLSTERLQLQLQQWLALSLNEKVPPSLLLLSRTLYLPETIGTEKSLAATISSLPEEVATRTKASIGKREGKIDNLTRLEIIKSEEKKIAEDKKERSEEEKKKKLDETKKKIALVGRELELDALNLNAISGSTKKSETIKEKIIESEQFTAEDIDSVEEAIDMLEIEKKRAFMDKQELLDLKSELADYKEDILDFKQALKTAGLDEKSLHESKAARRLFHKVNQMITKIDPVVAHLNKEKESLQKIIQQDSTSQEEKSKEEEELINLEELTNHLTCLLDSSNVSKVKKIQSVLSKMDDDLDGAVKADDVRKVLELLSDDRENMSSELFEEIVEMMVKEDQMEAQALIQKALKLPSIRSSLNKNEDSIKE